jgi:hypothetical protein
MTTEVSESRFPPLSWPQRFPRSGSWFSHTPKLAKSSATKISKGQDPDSPFLLGNALGRDCERGGFIKVCEPTLSSHYRLSGLPRCRCHGVLHLHRLQNSQNQCLVFTDWSVCVWGVCRCVRVCACASVDNRLFCDRCASVWGVRRRVGVCVCASVSECLCVCMVLCRCSYDSLCKCECA